MRCRPLNPRELQLSDFETVKILNSKLVVLLDPGNEFEPEDIFRKNRNKEVQYAFDFAFDKVTSWKNCRPTTTPPSTRTPCRS